MSIQNNTTELQAILDAVNNLPNAGGGEAAPVLQSKTVTPTTSEQTVTPDSGYDGLEKVTVGAMPVATQATPSITVSDNGLITASAEQAAGYVNAGTKEATKQLATKGAATITPSTSEQTAVPAGTYVTGDIKVAAVSGSGEGQNAVEVTVSVKTQRGSSFSYVTADGELVTTSLDDVNGPSSVTVVALGGLILSYHAAATISGGAALGAVASTYCTVFYFPVAGGSLELDGDPVDDIPLG